VSSDQTMVELARVLNDAQGAANTPNNIEVAKEEVKSVLLALRQPSKGMVRIGGRIDAGLSSGRASEAYEETASEVFTAMIDATLSEGEG